jgi:hypothetical protein
LNLHQLSLYFPFCSGLEIMSEACTNMPVSGILVRAAQATTVVLVALAMSALYKALSLQAAADASIAAGGASLKKEAKASANLALTQHQQTLLGLPVNGPKKPAVEKGEAGSSGDSTGIKNVRQRPPWVRLSPTQPSLPASSPALMVPVHPTVPKGSRGNVAAGAGSLWATRGSPVASSSPVSSLSPSGTISTLGAPYSSQVKSPGTLVLFVQICDLQPQKSRCAFQCCFDSYLCETTLKGLSSVADCDGCIQLFLLGSS